LSALPALAQTGSNPFNEQGRIDYGPQPDSPKCQLYSGILGINEEIKSVYLKVPDGHEYHLVNTRFEGAQQDGAPYDYMINHSRKPGDKITVKVVLGSANWRNSLDMGLCSYYE
jgi:hypothetical protein